MAEDNNDSGMESQEGSQVQDVPSPETNNSPEKEKRPEIEGEYDDEPDESIAERLWGLSEMFPETVRNATESAVEMSEKSIKSLYAFSRGALWVVFSTSIILFAPVIFEVERANMEEMQRSQQKQMLLGPNTAVSGGGLPLMPPVQR